MKDFFDRKTFDPVSNLEHQKTLNVLRAYGASRRVPSTALDWALRETTNYDVFVDLGCGESWDWQLARTRGFANVSRIDLCPLFQKSVFPNRPYPNPTDFIQADVAEHIPFPDNTVNVAISQAVLDLIEPVAREQFFQEVNRVLRPGGLFTCYLQWLQPGWGFDIYEERERAARVFGLIEDRSGGFIARKGDSK